MKSLTQKRGNQERRKTGSASSGSLKFIVHRSSFILPPLSFILFLAVFGAAFYFATSSSDAQTRQRRNGAHSVAARESFTPADRLLVERAIGATCDERVRDPLGSVPIDEMQTRPSLSVGDPAAVAGARRAERLLPTTKQLVANAIVELAKDYDFYTAANRAR
ncbi:MAG TPA: hypothetical protein VHD88_05955, partial [Pyrinomonadaceae bacterium]|nr:hypothetical protein [Pyrinomonadaceae bacterium]